MGWGNVLLKHSEIGFNDKFVFFMYRVTMNAVVAGRIACLRFILILILRSKVRIPYKSFFFFAFS